MEQSVFYGLLTAALTGLFAITYKEPTLGEKLNNYAMIVVGVSIFILLSYKVGKISSDIDTYRILDDSTITAVDLQNSKPVTSLIRKHLEKKSGFSTLDFVPIVLELLLVINAYLSIIYTRHRTPNS